MRYSSSEARKELFLANLAELVAEFVARRQLLPQHRRCAQDLHPLDKLFAAHASVHGALGVVKIRCVIHKLSGLWAQRYKSCNGHWERVQLFLPD